VFVYYAICYDVVCLHIFSSICLHNITARSIQTIIVVGLIADGLIDETEDIKQQHEQAHGLGHGGN
jgi:hypothetical protein